MKLARKIAAGMLMATMLTISVSAASFSDVPSWAQKSVDTVSDRGYLVGDINGKFNPYESVDKFQLVDVLAKFAGYKDPLVNPNMTQAEKNDLAVAVAKNKGIIEDFEKAYSSWDRSHNEKIAYLIHKDILDQSDLSEFVYKINSVERKKIVTRQEISRYIVRILGLEEEALLNNVTRTSFTDDAQILQEYKPYVELVKQKGIIIGSDNKFSPTTNVSKVTLAIVIDNVINYQEKFGIKVDNPSFPDNSYNINNPINNNATILSGQVIKVYDLSSYKGLKFSGRDSVYKISNNVNYYENNVLKYGDSLNNMVRIGDSITVNIDQENYITDIYFVKTNNPIIDNPLPPTENPDEKPVNLEELHGIITQVDKQFDGNYKIKVEVINVVWGETVVKEKEYIVRSDLKIKQNGEEVLPDELEIDSRLSAKVDMAYVYEAITQTKVHEGMGKIIGRKMTATKEYLLIENEAGKVQKYLVSEDTRLSRKYYKVDSWLNLKIGDTVSYEAELDTLLKIDASGKKATVEGTVIEVEISDNPKVTVVDDDGEKIVINVSHSTDIRLNESSLGTLYDIRVGQTVEASLDSEEVYYMNINKLPSSTTYIGYIEDFISDNSVVIKVKRSDNSDEYYLKVFNIAYAKAYKDGRYTDKSNLEEEMKVELKVDTTKPSKVIRIDYNK